MARSSLPPELASMEEPLRELAEATRAYVLALDRARRALPEAWPEPRLGMSFHRDLQEARSVTLGLGGRLVMLLGTPEQRAAAVKDAP